VPALDTPDPRTLLGGERHVLELIATGAPLGSILDALCRVIDEQSGLRSSIVLLDAAGDRLVRAASPHVPDPTKTDAAGERHPLAAWSTPFYASDGRTLGTFAVFSDNAGAPSPRNLELVDRGTHLASIAVEHDLIARGLRESERRFSTAFYSSPGCFSIIRASDTRFM